MGTAGIRAPQPRAAFATELCASSLSLSVQAGLMGAAITCRHLLASSQITDSWTTRVSHFSLPSAQA